MSPATLTPPLRQPHVHVEQPGRGARPASAPARHWLWLAACVPFSFAVPFLLADRLELQRDLFYGLYALAVAAFVAGWARHTGLSRRGLARNWRWGLVLGVVGAAATAFVVLRTEDATSRPGGVELAAAVLWRGVVYGATDGVLLSVFPILAVFGALAGTRLSRRRAGKVAIGALALLASLGITATYHLGYSDFRSEKLRKPLVGDVIWSAPTLVTLSPLGAPIAHVGLHVSAVLHTYDTDTFLPPHGEAAPATGHSGTAVFFTGGTVRVSVFFPRGTATADCARVLAVPRRVEGPAVLTGALRALLRGPTAAEQRLRYGGWFSARTAGALRSVRIRYGVALVDLRDFSRAIPNASSSCGSALLLAQLDRTATQFPSVRRAVYSFDGSAARFYEWLQRSAPARG